MPQPPRSRPLVDPAVQAGELIIRLGVFILAVGAPCAAALSRRAIFSLTPIGAILLLIGAVLLPHRSSLRERFAPFLAPMGLAVIFLTLWSGVSIIWTPWPANAESRFVRTAATLLVVALAGTLGPARTKTPNLYLASFGVGAAAAATLFLAIYQRAQLLADGVSLDDSTLARASVGVALLAWPALAALAVREKWVWAAALACLSAAAVVAVGSPYAIAGLAAGAIVFPFAAAWPRRVGRLFAALVALAFVFGPLATLAAGALVARFAHPPAFLDSLPAWGSFVRQEGLRLVTGHGLDAAGPASAAGLTPVDAPRSLLWEVWYELGFVGALAAAALAAAAFAAAAGAAQPLAPFALAALACGLVLAFAALPAAQLWWVTLASLAALFFAWAKRGRYRTQRPRVALVNAERRPRQPAA